MIYRFGEYSVDTDLLELRRDGEAVSVEPQVFRLLAYLLDNRDRVVDKDELIGVIWEGRVVSDATLNTRINAVRRAVGDDGKTQSIVRTYPRRGFRFVAEVEQQNPIEHQAGAGAPRAAGDGSGISTVSPGSSERPLIVVLPFQNLSGDEEQDYFADGITEDLINALSRFRWAYVIGRNTSFSLKERSAGARAVAEELGVRYAVDGSVRKAGNRVRVTAELIEAPLDRHLWTDRYDRNLEDVFKLQDEIAEKVATAIQPVLESTEILRAGQKPPESLEAWDHVMRGRALTMHLEKELNAQARTHFQTALKSDANYVPALTGLAITHAQDILFNWSDNPPESIAESRRQAERAARINDNDAAVHCALGLALFLCKEPDNAIRHYQRAIELNPSFALAYGYLAIQLAYAGEPEAAIEAAHNAMRLSPHDPELFHFYVAIATAHYVSGRYAEALEWAWKTLRERERVPAALRLVAASHAQLGNMDDARAALDEVLAVSPRASLGLIQKVFHFKHPEHMERYVDGLRKAGMPE